jgi:predicted  nucleic acid-binding Zn-ribbon protein
MPHQCVRCGTFYEDGAEEILKGCSCGAKLFFYVKQEKLDKARQMTAKLSDDEKHQIEKDVLDIVGIQPDEDSSVVLDIESVNVYQPGKFEIDLVKLFDKDKPLVYKLEEGKYVIDVAESFMRSKEYLQEKK